MGGKLKAALVLAAMYFLGVMSGMGWQLYRYQHRMIEPVFIAHRVSRLKKELRLTPEQEVAVRQIFEKAHERARQVNEEVSWDLSDIHHDSVQAIRQVLTPEQQREFDEIHRRAHARHHHPMEAPTPTAETASQGATS